MYQGIWHSKGPLKTLGEQVRAAVEEWTDGVVRLDIELPLHPELEKGHPMVEVIKAEKREDILVRVDARNLVHFYDPSVIEDASIGEIWQGVINALQSFRR